MAVIMRHPAWAKIARLAHDVLEQHRPQDAAKCTVLSANLLVRELYRFLTIKQLVLHSRTIEKPAADDLQVSPGFLVDALWHAVLLESEASTKYCDLCGWPPHALLLTIAGNTVLVGGTVARSMARLSLCLRPVLSRLSLTQPPCLSSSSVPPAMSCVCVLVTTPHRCGSPWMS